MPTQNPYRMPDGWEATKWHDYDRRPIVFEHPTCPYTVIRGHNCWHLGKKNAAEDYLVPCPPSGKRYRRSGFREYTTPGNAARAATIMKREK